MSKKKQDGDSLIQAIIEIHNPLLEMAESRWVKPAEMEQMLISALKKRGNVDESRLGTLSRRRAFIKSALSGFIEAMREGVASGAYSKSIERAVVYTFGFIQPAFIVSSKGKPMSIQSARLACSEIYCTWVSGGFREAA